MSSRIHSFHLWIEWIVWLSVHRQYPSCRKCHFSRRLWKRLSMSQRGIQQLISDQCNSNSRMDNIQNWSIMKEQSLKSIWQKSWVSNELLLSGEFYIRYAIVVVVICLLWCRPSPCHILICTFYSSMGGTDPNNFLNKVGKKSDGSGNGDILLWKRKAERYLVNVSLY